MYNLYGAVARVIGGCRRLVQYVLITIYALKRGLRQCLVRERLRRCCAVARIVIVSTC